MNLTINRLRDILNEADARFGAWDGEDSDGNDGVAAVAYLIGRELDQPEDWWYE